MVSSLPTRGRRRAGTVAVAALASLGLTVVGVGSATADGGDQLATQAEFEHIGGGQFPGVQFAARVSLTDAAGAPLDTAAGTTAQVTDGSGAVTPAQLSPLGD